MLITTSKSCLSTDTYILKEMSGCTELPSILLIAYGCEPNASSEPGVGWNFMRQIASFANVCVVTRANNRQRIENALLTEPAYVRDRVAWVYFDIKSLANLKNRVPFGIQGYYALWQWRVLLLGRKLKRENHFDCCHHLTYGVSWLSPVTAFIQKPFLWGPIGGGDVMPWNFRFHEPAKSLIQETIYAVLSRFLPVISPIALLVRKRASAIIFRTRSTENTYPVSPNAKRYVICETAMDNTTPPAEKNHEQPLQTICVARFEYWKGVQYTVKGYHWYIKQGGQGKLVILGDGPYRERLKKYCRENDLENFIHMPGHVSTNEVESCLRKANVMLYTSFRDGGSWAVLEAMNNGIPVICLNRSGLADMVDQDSGILLDTVSPYQLTRDIGEALLNLERNPILRKSLCEGARNRVDNAYRWEHRLKQLSDVYSCLLQPGKYTQ